MVGAILNKNSTEVKLKLEQNGWDYMLMKTYYELTSPSLIRFPSYIL